MDHRKRKSCSANKDELRGAHGGKQRGRQAGRDIPRSWSSVHSGRCTGPADETDVPRGRGKGGRRPDRSPLHIARRALGGWCGTARRQLRAGPVSREGSEHRTEKRVALHRAPRRTGSMTVRAGALRTEGRDKRCIIGDQAASSGRGFSHVGLIHTRRIRARGMWMSCEERANVLALPHGGTTGPL